MKKSELLHLGLPKWPCMLVAGKSVTPEQAMAIIIRTDSWSFSTNDHGFAADLRAIAGLSQIDRYTTHFDLSEWQKKDAQDRKVKESYGVLEDLEYLHNERLVSCWVGGPHGWCDWQGSIFADNYNIGKWPSVEEVYKEWVIIAKAFPFLDLRSQLLSGESCEEDLHPVVEFVVKDGKVRIKEPKSILQPTQEAGFQPTQEAGFLCLSDTSDWEHGTTLANFQKALNVTQDSLRGE